MKRINVTFIGLLCVLLQVSAQASLPDFTQIVERSKASIVNISTVKKSSINNIKRKIQIPNLEKGSPLEKFFERFLGEDGLGQFKDKESASLGSGFIISKDGYILTNHHVVSGADEVIVRLSSREEYKAKLIGSDKSSDVALLKIDGKNLPTLKFGDSNKLKVGEWVLAIGSPFGFDQTVTAGIVSAKGRSLPNENYVPFIQTDVAINPGNSGGPLFNLKGEVIGINSQIYSRTGGFMGLSFAIPIEMAIDVMDQIKNNGSVSRGWLGVLIQEVSAELAESFGMSMPHGALVAQVIDDSPASKSDLKVGDVIVAFNGSRIARSSGLPPLVGRAPVGKESTLTVVRNKKEKQIKIIIDELPNEMTQANNVKDKAEKENQNVALGMEFTDKIDKAVKKALHIKAGILVTNVMDGAAHEAGIRKGDVITMLDNQTVETINDMNTAIDGLLEGKSVAMLVQRTTGPVFLAIKP